MLLRPFADFLHRLRHALQRVFSSRGRLRLSQNSLAIQNISFLAAGGMKRKATTFPLSEVLENRVLLTVNAVQVADIFAGSSNSFPDNLTDVNGTLFFSAKDEAHGIELWKTDGTSAGTFLVKDIVVGPVSSAPKNLVNVNGTLFFSVHDGVHGYELWKSDGSDAGTVLVKDINPGATGSFPASLTNVNGTLYFSADNGFDGPELWKSDGSTDGTVMVKDIQPGGYLSNIDNLTNVGGLLYFTADDAVHGSELWKSDGTEAGTVLVKDIFPGIDPTFGDPNSSYPANLTNVNGTLFFTAHGTSSDYELWKSNGTTAGTVLVKDVNADDDSYDPGYLTNVNGTLYFAARDTDGGGELWKSNGTTAGTVVVKEFQGNSYYGLSDIVNVNGTVYFGAGDRAGGVELWKSNGTAGGTDLVKNLNPGTLDSSIYQLTNINGTLYFVADNGSTGLELWQSDGTAAGTVLVKDIVSGADGSYPESLTNANGILYFTAETVASGKELWRISDGNLAPTGISLSKTTIGDHSSPNAVVGTFSTTDPNSGEAFTYSLVSGTGATDNASFTITGNTLKLIPASNSATQSSYAIRVKVTDHGGLTFEKQFTITVTQVSQSTPVLTLNTATLVYHVASKQSVAVSGSATIAASDGSALNFNGATLQVSGHSSKDTVSILKQGGGITAKGKKVLAGKTLIGTISGGKKGAALSVHFNASATQGQVQTVLRNVAFKSTDKVGGNRTLKVQIKNIGSASSNQVQKTIQVGP